MASPRGKRSATGRQTARQTAVLDRPARAAPPGVLAFVLAVFVGAFLLFQIQPIMGKFVLPRFGGGGEVWTTCLLFFQLLLLAGYAYAHLLVRYASRRVQAAVHLVLLVAALAVVPLGVRMMQHGFSAAGEDPTLAILALLTAAVGLPYVALSATGPLVQGWFAQTWPGRSPYRLYAMSNAGSLLALLSYPVLVEPSLTRLGQMHVWWAGLGVFGVLAWLCARRLMKAGPIESLSEAGGTHAPSGGKLDAGQQAQPDARKGAWVLWVLLPAAAVVELMAVTTGITQDIAPIPLLWIVPLSLYLVSFIVCFDRPGWYRRWIAVPVLLVLVVGVMLVRRGQLSLPMAPQIAAYCLMLFACCMVCHGELYRLRPAPRRLTGYYLLIATGGALGGLFVAVAAPRLLNVYVEMELGLGLAMALLVMAAWRRRPGLAAATAGLILAVTAAVLWTGLTRLPATDLRTVDRSRSFYGLLEIVESKPGDPQLHQRGMIHGTTLHGQQLMGPRRREPLSYYWRNSGVGRAVTVLQGRGPVSIGVVGLGVGTLATYCREGDQIAFYELNPHVEDLARRYFTYLADCPGRCNVYLGDGRLVLESQADQHFDLLVLDAFSSDSIPLHLLTTEAMDTYLRHLKPDGVLAFHVTSSYVDLMEVLRELAGRHGLYGLHIADPGGVEGAARFSRWVVLSKDIGLLLKLESAGPSEALDPTPGKRAWSDDYANVLAVLKNQWAWRRETAR